MVTVNLHLQWNWRSIVVGLAFLGFLIATKILVCTTTKQKMLSPSTVFHRNYTRIKEFKLQINIFYVQLTPPGVSQGQNKKKLFWVSAIAPRTSVILSTLFVFLARADKHVVKIVRVFPNLKIDHSLFWKMCRCLLQVLSSVDMISEILCFRIVV